MEATIYIDPNDSKRWEELLEQEVVDYEKENIPRFSCVFVMTAIFPDGTMADLKVCSCDTNQSLFSEMVAYDSQGHELWMSEASNGLLGPWEFELKNLSGAYVKYRVDVVEKVSKDLYGELGCSRGELCRMIVAEIEKGTPMEYASKYASKIADEIADKVAEDIIETSDIKNWNTWDVRLGTGRVITKSLGVSV